MHRKLVSFCLLILEPLFFLKFKSSGCLGVVMFCLHVLQGETLRRTDRNSAAFGAARICDVSPGS